LILKKKDFQTAFKGFSIDGVDYLVEGVNSAGQSVTFWRYSNATKNFSIFQTIPGEIFGTLTGNMDFCTPCKVKRETNQSHQFYLLSFL
jgi:hypothetical protein